MVQVVHFELGLEFVISELSIVSDLEEVSQALLITPNVGMAAVVVSLHLLPAVLHGERVNLLITVRVTVKISAVFASGSLRC